MDELSVLRNTWIKRNHYYYEELIKYLKFVVPEGCAVLEIGTGTGHLLNALKPGRGVGIDISNEMLKIARGEYPHLDFFEMDVENITINEKFDYVIMSDTVGLLEDVQKAFNELGKISHADMRLIITFHNFLWQPLLRILEVLKMKMPSRNLNWLNFYDLSNLLELSNFEVISYGNRLLLPARIPLLSTFVNKYIANLPLLNRLCSYAYIIARPKIPKLESEGLPSVSIIIPARNERGNIEKAIMRIPSMGSHTEIIFVEGHSTDGTMDEIKRACGEYSHLDVKYDVQDGRGKADAVWKGFLLAKDDILMILDADLTVPPEELPKFYDAIVTGKGEFIMGSRLVYPLERQSMRTLNMLGNKFFSVVFSWLLGQRIKDTLCGTKVISRSNWKRLFKEKHYFGDFDPFGDFDLLFGSAKMNLKIVEVPIRYQAREYGETNISRFKHGWLLLKMLIFAIKKIKFV
jgi:SAM-dependent methyltransferase